MLKYKQTFENVCSKEGDIVMNLWKKKGAAFEDFVAYVYQSLLDINDYPSIVSKRVKVRGLDGTEGEIDVYYEFEHLDMTYRVAIECKDWKTPITVNQVRDFYAKIERISNVAGVMIATNGYQTGAKDFAEKRGILLLNENDLPAFNVLLGRKIGHIFLPDEKSVGEPFWTIMGLRDGKVDGTYINLFGENMIPLFISKKMAEALLSTLPDRDEWCVRGLTRRQFKALLDMADLNKWEFGYSPVPIENNQIQFICIGRDILREHYVY